LRRKGNKDVPELQPRKKVKKEEGENPNLSVEEAKFKNEIDELNTLDPQIFEIHGQKDSKI